MRKMFYGLRFEPELYNEFKRIATDNGYTITSAFERFMQGCVEADDIVFAQNATPNFEAEARVLLDWLNKGKRFYHGGGSEEINIQGKLFYLMTKVADAALKREIEEALKKSVTNQT